eukprot:scaffold4600_cov245-Pinguiococcus_pyrenoidosus.AAC.5
MMPTKPNKTILIIGAGGPTGALAAKYAAAKGYVVKAGSRSGAVPERLAGVEGLVPVVADATDLASLRAASQGCDAVIFAASQSRNAKHRASSSAQAVDRDGARKAAEACIAERVPRFMLISSAVASKPDCGMHRFLNYMEGNQVISMKYEGELAVSKLYADLETTGLSYTIIRPGGLTDKAPVGPTRLQLGIKDELAGYVSREDVAALTVEAIDSDDLRNTTFEAFNYGTAARVTTFGIPLTLLWMTTGYPLASTSWKPVDGWSELFGTVPVMRDAGTSF